MPLFGRARRFGSFAARVARAWRDDKASLHATAMAFYGMLSLVPLLLLMLTLSGEFSDASVGRNEFLRRVRSFAGPRVAETFAPLIPQEGLRSGSAVESLAQIAILVFAATWGFREVRTALRAIWGLPEEPRRNLAWRWIAGWFWSGVMVAGVGVVLALSLSSSLVLSYVSRTVTEVLPTTVLSLRAAQFMVSLVLVTLLCAMAYKLLAETRIAWRDVWFGAVATSLLMAAGNVAVAWYLRELSARSIYGTAGSIFALLIWVNYATHVFLLGAEMSKVRAEMRGAGASGGD